MIYINNIALQGGEKNLMDNKQRIDLCLSLIHIYRKSIIKMYAEIFNELGINKYVIQIKNLKKYKEPIYKLINTIGL